MASVLAGRRTVLLLLTAVELMIFLDTTVVNIALPSIANDLGMSETQLAWVVNAYLITFGGFQLVGGRAADLLGRRGTFELGVGLFTLASLAAGLSSSAWMLITARAVQGLGAALVVPAEISLITAIFTEPQAYRRAFGVWSAMGAVGAASGTALGGILTQVFGWPWIFLINIPIGGAALLFSRRLLPARAPHAEGAERKRLDLPGALTGTAALLLLTYAITATAERGFDVVTVGSACLAVALGVGFVVIEARVPNPLLPLRLLAVRNVSGAGVASVLVGAAHVPAFVFLSLYLQQVLGYTAIQAGFAMLPVALVNIAVSRTLVPAALERLGARGVLGTGCLLLTAGLGLFARVPVQGSYVVDVLPASLIFALGLPAVFVGSTVPAVKSVAGEDTGIAAGIVQTAQRVGSGLGVTVLAALAAAWTQQAEGPRLATLTAGLNAAFLGAAVIAAAGVVVAFVMLRPIEQTDDDHHDEHAAAAGERE